MTRNEIIREGWNKFTFMEKVKVGGYLNYKATITRAADLIRFKGLDSSIALDIAREEQSLEVARLIGTFIGAYGGIKILEKFGWKFQK